MKWSRMLVWWHSIYKNAKAQLSLYILFCQYEKWSKLSPTSCLWGHLGSSSAATNAWRSVIGRCGDVQSTSRFGKIVWFGQSRLRRARADLRRETDERPEKWFHVSPVRPQEPVKNKHIILQCKVEGSHAVSVLRHS